MIFFVCFVMTIAVYTAYQNIAVVGIFFVVIGIISAIYQFFSTKKIYTIKTVRTITLAIVLALMCCGIKEWRYGYDNSIVQKNTYIGSGIIHDMMGEGKYLFTTLNGKYLLYSKKMYRIWTELRLVGNLQTNAYVHPFTQWRISSSTFLRPLFTGSFDAVSWFTMKWRKGSIYETNALIIQTQSAATPTFMRIKQRVRQRVIMSYGDTPEAWLLLGMLIGDKSYIPKASYQSFIDSGLVHLIAVSGGNILMIVVFLHYVLCRIPFYPRIGIIVGVIIGYGILCGLDSSVFRAVIMWGMSMLALFWWREIPIWKLLSWSALIMLAINPYFLLYDTGFLLSYSALIGIVVFQHVTTPPQEVQKEKLHRWKKSVISLYKTYISPSIWASIGIFPIIIFFMGKINLVSIGGNIVILPIVPFVMIYGCISVLLAVIWPRQGIRYIEYILLKYIYAISDILSAYGIYLSVSGLRVKYVVCVISGGLFVWWYTKQRNKKKQEWISKISQLKSEIKQEVVKEI